MICAIIVNAIATSDLISEEYVLLFGLINVVATIGFTLALFRWGVLYTVGWIFASAILVQTGLLSVVDILIYLGAPIAILGWRVWDWFNNQ